MAFDYTVLYPGQIGPASVNFPYGEPQNITIPGDGTGTPWEADLLRDVFGFHQSLLTEAGITPINISERATDSQYLQSLTKIIGRRFDTLNELKTSFSVKINDYVRINGRITAGDGGENLYKIVSAATGTDDGGSYIDLPGSGLQAQGLFPTQTVRAEQFGSIGDDATDNVTALQAFIDFINTQNRIGQLFRGVHQSTALTYASNTVIVGAGTLKAHSTLGASTALLLNTNIPAGFGNRTDTNIVFDITIDGNVGVLGDRSVELVSAIKCTDIKFLGKIQNVGYTGIAFGGCKNVIFNGEASNTGKAAVSAEGGAAVLITPYLGDSTPCEVVRMEEPYIHDTNWSAVYVNGRDIEIIGPQFCNIQESALFGVPERLSVVGGVIKNVVKKNISAHGIELGGVGVDIRGTIIEETDGSAVSLTDVQNFNINVTTKNARRDAASFPTASHIDIITQSSDPNQPIWGKISGCQCTDTSLPSNAAVSIAGTGAAVRNIDISNNNFAGTSFTAGDPIQIQTGKWGTGSRRENNSGTVDDSPAMGEVALNVVTGNQSVTGVGFRPSALILHAIANSGTASQSSVAKVDNSGTAFCQTQAADGTNATCFSAGAKTVFLTTPAGATLIDATFVSFDEDGFTINIGATTGATGFLQYTAIP